MKAYQDRYTWNYYRSLEEGDVLVHTDNSVSIAFRWDGLSTSLESESKINNIFRNMYTAYHELPDDQSIFIENHFLRDYSDTVCDDYYSWCEKHTVRNREFSLSLRKDLANFIKERAMSNTILTVITISKNISPLDNLLPKRTIDKSIKEGIRLIDIAGFFMAHLDSAKLLTYKEFDFLLWNFYHRESARTGTTPPPNPRFKISHRVAKKPVYEDGLLKLDDNYCKPILLLDYPDADANWFYRLANSSSIEIHVTQIIKPVDVGRSMLASASQSKRSSESAMTIGGETVAQKVKDHNTYRNFISENKLHTYKNAYVIKLHDKDKSYLKDYTRRLIKTLGPGTLIAPDSEELSLTLWRISQLAQGHKSPFLREDHTLQIVNMSPIINFNGEYTDEKQMLRLTRDAKALTFSFPRDGTNHALTTAKTGSGKGVETVTEIVELFPLGVDFFIAEVGTSYKWTVEGFNGNYFDLSPDSVVSPFPEFSLADPSREKPLDTDLIAPTIGALLPMIGEGFEHKQHVTSVGEQIMTEIYSHEAPDGLLSPTLATYYDCTEQAVSHFSGIQKKAVIAIRNNLDSFLSSSTGSSFDKADTINFTSGIAGVNFKELMQNDRLAKFLLVFIALRFKQLAFANSTPTRILIDELHEFARIDPVLITVLIQQLTRMGRKEAGAFHGISQETLDAALERGILNQISNRYFMFLQDGHDEAGELFKMNSTVLDRWKGFLDPETPGMNYRQCIRQYGQKSYDLHLQFPPSLLDLAHSSPRALELKKHIGSLTKDPFERLVLFREAMETNKDIAA